MCEYINELEVRGEKIGEAKLTALLEWLYDPGRDEEAKSSVHSSSLLAFIGISGIMR